MRLPDFIIFDFETLSTDVKTAPIISFGAIVGNWGDSVESLKSNGFYCNVKTTKQLTDYGLKPMKSTLDWWLKQSEEAQSIMKAKDKIDLDEALDKFTQYCTDNAVNNETNVWIRAPHFDNAIISNLYEKVYGERNWLDKFPLNHWKVRDTRTFCDIVYNVKNGYAPNRQELFEQYNIVEHNAVDDCIKEYLQLNQYFSIANE